MTNRPSIAKKALQYAGKNPVLVFDVLLVGGIAFGAYKLYKYISGDATSEEREKKDDAVLDLPINVSQLTMSESDLRIITNSIFQAMNQYGTDEKTILDSLNNLGSRDDLLFILKDFGFRLYNGAAEATSWVDKNMFSQKLDLIGWLKEELSGNDLKRVEAIFIKYSIPF